METEKTQNSEDFSSKQFGRVTTGTTTLDDVRQEKSCDQTYKLFCNYETPHATARVII